MGFAIFQIIWRGGETAKINFILHSPIVVVSILLSFQFQVSNSLYRQVAYLKSLNIISKEHLPLDASGAFPLFDGAVSEKKSISSGRFLIF